jgi:flagellar operon protein
MSENNIFIRPPQIGSLGPGTTTQKPVAKSGSQSFENLFQQQLKAENAVKFSAHALKRLESRNINFSNEDLALLNQAVDRAESKGAKESLVLMDQLALIVSIKNRTVITAVDGESMKENVFTNIDSAVIAK